MLMPSQPSPGHIITGIGIVSIAMVLMSMFYAMSTPSIPSPPPTPARILSQAMENKTDVLMRCIDESFEHHSPPTSKDQADIVTACSNGVKQLTDGPEAALRALVH